MSRKFAGVLLIAALTAGGCADKPAKIEVSEADGAKTTVVLPSGMTTSELIVLQTLTANAHLLRADRQDKAFHLQTAQLQAAQTTQARRDYFVFLTALFALTCGFFGRRARP